MIGIETLMRRMARATVTAALTFVSCVGVAAQETPLAESESPVRAADGPALWRLSDEDSEIWLFGSVHALRPGVDWRRPELMKALDSASVVYFEAPTDIIAQMRLQLVLARIGFNPRDTALTDYLSDEGDAHLLEALAKLDLSIDNFERMKPWLAFMMISAQSIAAEGAEVSEGVEVLLEVDVRKAKKEIRTFETLEQQMRFLADMPLETQIELLELSLAHFDEMTGQLDVTIDAWAAGDLERLEAVVFEGVDELPGDFFERLFFTRNKSWAEELDTLMDGEGVALVVVGAGHLVGPGNVIELLEQRGHVVERF